MQSALMEERAIQVASFDGIDVFQINSVKFKTNSINIFFQDRLDREHVTKNALLPAVLRRGCGSFPTFRDIALYLEELYGASFDCGVAKKGEQQLIQFYTEFISDRYTGENVGLFEKAFELMFEIITRPVLDNGNFREDYITQEKENLRKLIESRVNDKVQYSLERCSEEMCAGEPFAIYEYGFVSDLDKIDGRSLFEHYKAFLGTLPVKVYISGDVEKAKVDWAIRKLSGLQRGHIKDTGTAGIEKKIGEVKNITERMDITQGKLCLGFRTYTGPGDAGYYKLLVYNGILGGGIHSKLFQNVREKASLAYYVFSRLDKFKGLMLVGSGIEPENRDRAVEIILKQLEDMKAGNISDEEFDATIRTIETGLRSLKDSQLQMVDFYLSQAVAGTSDSFETIIDRVTKVGRQDVVQVAGKVKLDTVYFLTTNDGNDSAKGDQGYAQRNDKL